MTVHVNLLPEAYRKARRHEKWFRRGVAIWAALMVVELCGGLALYLRAGERRDLLAATEKARDATQSLQQELAETTRQATLIETNIVLARQLRATHRWSRLLSSLSQVAPEGIVLHAMATDPPKWSRTGPKVRPAQKTKGKQDETETEAPVKGTILSGYAAERLPLAFDPEGDRFYVFDPEVKVLSRCRTWW